MSEKRNTCDNSLIANLQFNVQDKLIDTHGQKFKILKDGKIEFQEPLLKQAFGDMFL